MPATVPVLRAPLPDLTCIFARIAVVPVMWNMRKIHFSHC